MKRRTYRRILDQRGEWVGVEIQEVMTKEEAAKRYPEALELLSRPDFEATPQRQD